jgi:hypothetical protein
MKRSFEERRNISESHQRCRNEVRNFKTQKYSSNLKKELRNKNKNLKK